MSAASCEHFTKFLICPQKHFDFLYRFAIIEVQEAAVENEAKLAAGFLARVLGTQNKGRLSYESYMYRPSRYAQTELYRKCGKRLAKLDKFFPDEAQAQVTVTVEKVDTVEIMLRSKDLAMRAEKTDERMEDALADAVDLLTRRVVKYRKRLGTKLTAAAAEIPATEPEESMDIVREKHFALKPCSTEEAILQMDLLGHSFFLYHSTENDKIQVVYRRADGGYGVLIPEA